MQVLVVTAVAFSALFSLSNAQSSCSTIAPSGAVKPSLASGYRAYVVATGLSKPRGIQFDSAGNLLVIEQGTGDLTALTLNKNGACVSVASSATVNSGNGLNHGLAVSNDGRTLYASSPQAVWSWSYDATTKLATNQQTVVTNMTTNDHTTRTLLLSQKVPGLLLVSRGSTANLDYTASMLSSGHSQIRAFNLKNMTGNAYQFDTDGLRLGWGLRNSVGVAEHPITGGIYSVENSGDQIMRDGVDVHQNNPGEEMNFHGYLNGTEYANQGKNYGYPWCFAAWGVSELPENSKIQVGDQFAIEASPDTDNQNRTDAYCAQQVAPRLTFQAHMAPIDIVFHNQGTEAWVSFHGSWDRSQPVGYKVSVISFKDGAPVDGPHSLNALTDIFANTDNSVCPDSCFRPAGLVFDSQGRLFVSSDATGEIYMITKEQATPTLTSTARNSASASLPPAVSSAVSKSSAAASSAAASATNSGAQTSSTAAAYSWRHSSNIWTAFFSSFLLMLV